MPGHIFLALFFANFPNCHDIFSRFGDFVHRIYPKEFEIKATTDTLKSASYIDKHIDIDGKDKFMTNCTTNAIILILYRQLSILLWQHPFITCVWNFHIDSQTLSYSLSQREHLWSSSWPLDSSWFMFIVGSGWSLTLFVRLILVFQDLFFILGMYSFVFRSP